jgi:hypothetical protein
LSRSNKGVASGETLSFFWSAPTSLHIFVRGAAVGEVNDVKLPRAIHAGFLGDDPSIPEARSGIPSGLSRLFQSMSGSGGGANTKRAGRALMPATMTEPASGIALPTKIEMGTADAPLSMHLLSCGLQVTLLFLLTL